MKLKSPALLGAAVLAFASVGLPAQADNGRLFMGQRHFVGGQGQTNFCRTRDFHMRLVGNTLTVMEAPNCAMIVGADGTITGHCVFSADVVDISGRLAGHNILLHATHVAKDNSVTCQYDIQMEEAPQQAER